MLSTGEMLRKKAISVSRHMLDFLEVVPRDIALISGFIPDTHTAPNEDGVIRANILQNLTRVLQGIA